MLYGRTRFSSLLLSFRESDLEEYGRKEASLSLRDILPLNPKQYDKHRAPKFLGQPTIVYFHVTVLSLDSINEESMVTRSKVPGLRGQEVDCRSNKFRNGD